MSETKVTDELKKGEELSIIKLIDSVIEYAYVSRASDIHIDPVEHTVRLRLRIDGVLQDSFALPMEMSSEIITRIKVLSGLRTDEHQAAQDGRFRINIDKVGPVDVRVSIVPTYHGENAVLRLLSDKNDDFTLENLSFSEKNKKTIEETVAKPHGMILCTGPTGSGKTTTLYTILKKLNSNSVSVITIEDPIEYAIGGIEQIQVNNNAGLTFANGLRSILRQDPDIIMVGEIRDKETASMAVNTALTGHLLLSTIHTNDAATSLPRLFDMGIEPYLITSTVNAIIGQRLVRKICDFCKTEKTFTETEINSLKSVLPEGVLKIGDKLSYGKGCDACGKTGYKGRIGLHEILTVDDDIREAILKKTSSGNIKKIAIKNGMVTMFEDGISKVKNHETTLEEVLRVIHE